MFNEENNQVNEALLYLAQGPSQQVFCHKGFIINGFKFHTKECDDHRKTQNSGIVVKGDGANNQEYYGIILKIIELEYMGNNKVVMFKCDWWDVESYGKGIKVDSHGITIVNRRHKLNTNEPFVLACQSEQVFYVEDISNANWLCVIKVAPRDFFDIPIQKEGEEDNEDKR